MSEIQDSEQQENQNARVYTNTGDNKFSYFNPDGGFFLANEFDQKHKSANLVGRFECYWYPNGAVQSEGYGFWRSEKTGLGKTGKRIYFQKNDIMDMVFQGKLNCTGILSNFIYNLCNNINVIARPI